MSISEISPTFQNRRYPLGVFSSPYRAAISDEVPGFRKRFGQRLLMGVLQDAVEDRPSQLVVVPEASVARCFQLAFDEHVQVEGLRDEAAVTAFHECRGVVVAWLKLLPHVKS